MQHLELVNDTTMTYPDNTPMVFSGAKPFVEQYGMHVWSELCDMYPTGKWLNVNEVARSIPFIQNYSKPERYLKAVLLAVETDYNNRKDDYEHKPPFIRRNRQMIWIML